MDSLCAAPPEQWSELLEKMGATVRPATEGPSGEPCTVSAWLDALQDQKAKEPPTVSPDVPASGPDSLMGTSPADKKRRERRLAEKTLTTAWEEDKRDLNDLLRDLGEPVSKAGQRRKAKGPATRQEAAEDCRAGGNVIKVSDPQPTLLASSYPAPELGAGAKVQELKSKKPQKTKASGEDDLQAAKEQVNAAPTSPRHSSFGSTSAGDSAGCNESDSKDDVNWVEVPTRASRREAKKRAGQQQLEIQTQDQEAPIDREPAKGRSPGKVTSNQPPSEALRLEVSVVDKAVLDKPMQKAPEEAKKTIELPASSNALQERGRGPQSHTYAEVLQETAGECSKRCLSVGDEPRRMAPAEVEEHSPSQFYGRPSVGTWLRQAGASPRIATQPQGVLDSAQEEIVLRDEAHQLEESSVALEPEEQTAGGGGSSWQVHPSVGTWLGTRPQEYNWPSTPDTTPRHACSSPMEEPVVWVAVPLRLLPLVQQVLQT